MEKTNIQKFVEGLMDSELNEAQQSVVLSTDAELIGAGNNSGCKNSYAASCKGDNSKCTNYGEACVEGTNPDCENKPNPGDLTPGQTQIGSAENPCCA